MKSFKGSNNSLVDSFQTLSLNSSASNASLATILLNDQHKYLLLKFFDNERSFTMTTMGSTTATLTTGPLTGATSATLASAWPTSLITCEQLVVFSDGEQRNVKFTQGSTNITWQSPLSTGTTATLATLATLVGVQSYPLPANVSKIKNGTITVGQLVYTPAPVQSIQEWTKLNALPYNSSIPAYFYIYNNQINFFPIPSSFGQVITLYCQVQAADMTYSDYTTGTITAGGMAVGSNIITATGSSFSTAFPAGVDLTFANIFFIALPPGGDGIAYQVQSVQSATQLTLFKPVVYTPNVSGATFTIGQYPLLSPDFHDAILYGALRIYYMSIKKDSERYELYNGLFNEKLEQMKFYLSNKSVNVDLGTNPILNNPNLFIQSQS